MRDHNHKDKTMELAIHFLSITGVTMRGCNEHFTGNSDGVSSQFAHNLTFCLVAMGSFICISIRL